MAWETRTVTVTKTGTKKILDHYDKVVANNHGGTTNSDGQNGGGGSGWAFIYCNNAINTNTEGTVIENA
jgi:hypothetical protein